MTLHFNGSKLKVDWKCFVYFKNIIIAKKQYYLSQANQEILLYFFFICYNKLCSDVISFMFGKYLQSLSLFFKFLFFSPIAVVDICSLCILRYKTKYLTFRDHLDTRHSIFGDLAIFASPQPYNTRNIKKRFPLSTFLLLFSSSLIWFLSTFFRFEIFFCLYFHFSISEVFNPLKFSLRVLGLKSVRGYLIPLFCFCGLAIRWWILNIK